MNFPRAIRGPVLGMARPARPAAEAAAVAEAAARIRAETGHRAVQPIAREIARRVVAELLTDLDRDPLEAALVEPSAVRTLATCAEIDTVSLFVERRVERLRARAGRDLSPFQQAHERREVAIEITNLLSNRYARALHVTET